MLGIGLGLQQAVAQQRNVSDNIAKETAAMALLNAQQGALEKRGPAQQGEVLPTLLHGTVPRDHSRPKQDTVLQPVSEEQKNVRNSVSGGIPILNLKEQLKTTESGSICQDFKLEGPMTERTSCFTRTEHTSELTEGPATARTSCSTRSSTSNHHSTRRKKRTLHGLFRATRTAPWRR